MQSLVKTSNYIYYHLSFPEMSGGLSKGRFVNPLSQKPAASKGNEPGMYDQEMHPNKVMGSATS